MTGVWGRRPRDWAELAEPENTALFEAVLDQLPIEPGTRVLDAACGSGLAASMAAERGAVVSGFDSEPELLAIARERVPGGYFVKAELDSLPYADGAFEVVTGFNAFQFATDPVVAVREAGRVGAVVAATTFAEPERCESTALHLAMRAVRGDEPVAGYSPYSLSSPGGLEQLMTAAGLTPIAAGEVPVVWGYDDPELTIRALLSSAGGALAIEAAGEERVRAALAEALEAFPDGMNNVFRYAIGRSS
jgi:SAM-dependent methyltransferase